MSTKDFLIEIGTEELPPKSLLKLAEAFANNISANLEKLTLTHEDIHIYATPRRIAVLIKDLVSEQSAQEIERKGPALSAAFDKDGKPTPAAIGFASSCHTTIDKLKTIENEKGSWLYFKIKQSGQKTVVLLPEIIIEATKKLPIAKLMRWGDGDFEFVRPVHWVLMLYGNKIIKTDLFGITAGNLTYGHRFHHPEALAINEPNEYEALLKKAYVIADFNKRKAEIIKQITKVAAEYGEPVLDDELLDEITALVEWPVALLGEFSSRFLQLPPEVLITSMQHHQKCLAIRDEKKKLLAIFIAVSNIKSKNPKQVIAGNERVINARLTDAEFFYHEDIKNPLATFCAQLKQIIFQAKLGTLADKTSRVVKLSAHIAKQINYDINFSKRAAELAKADLATKMVGEFPELQGIMGYYYAKYHKEPKEIATALNEQYMPRFASDSTPKTAGGAVLAIADRIDTIVGIFGINQQPTGAKDPFALRRAALGILRTIIDNKLDLDLNDLITFAFSNFTDKLINKNADKEAMDFILERFRAWYLEQNITPQIFAAVMAKYPTRPLDFQKRISAVCEFTKLPEADSLASANKRVSNILEKTPIKVETLKINQNLLLEGDELELAKQLFFQEEKVLPLYQNGDYTKALTTLSALKKPIDNFFDHVLVMTDDEHLKLNRLALLNKLRELFLYVADISLLQK